MNTGIQTHQNFFQKLAVGSAAVFLCLAGISFAQLEQEESLVRQENALLARELVKQGDLSYNQSDYKQAHQAYKQALDLLGKSPSLKTYIDAIHERYSTSAVELSKSYNRIGQQAQARQVLHDVLESSSSYSTLEVKKQLQKLDDPIRSNPSNSLEHSQAVQEVARLLRRAEGYFDLGVFDKALVEYESVLQVDPTNKAARRGMEKIHKSKSQYYQSAYDETRARLINEVAEAWETPTTPQVDLENLIDGDQVQEGVILSGRDFIENKLKNTIIPVVDLDDTSIQEIYNLLEVWSRQYDPSIGPEESKGINFTVNLGDAQSEQGALLRERSISLRLTQIPMYALIEHVCQQLGLGWNIREHTVNLFPLGELGVELVTRSYKVSPRFLASQSKADPANDNDPFATANLGSGTRLSRLSPTEQLTKKGVTFPENTHVSYIPSQNRLNMTNTPGNHDILEQLIELDAKSGGVQIIIKFTFMDVLQSNLKELGVDWLVTGSNNLSGGSVGNGGALSPILPSSGGAGSQAFSPITSGLRSGSQAITDSTIDSFLSPIGNDVEAVQGLESRAPGILSASSQVGDSTLQAILSGLDQKKDTSQVWQTSLIAHSGQKSLIVQGIEFPYPEEYEPPELPNSFNTASIENDEEEITFLGGILPPLGFPVTPSHPTAFLTKNLGVKLEVEPTLSADRNYVSLRLEGEFRDLDGFINYGTPITGSRGDLITENAILMPVFNIERINSAVDIYDGSTIALGGLLQTSIQKVEDQVPILGSLPMVGDLFKRDSYAPNKRAIVMFVNVELRDPTGAPINNRSL